jgi:hypothetical protein
VPQPNLQSFKNKEKIKMAKIDIKDLIGGAVENALARREEALTIEETNQIQGGFSKEGGQIVNPDWPPDWPIIDPTTTGMFPTNKSKAPTF